MRSRVVLRDEAEHPHAVMIYYTGIDYHKRYSVACTLDAQGHKIREARIDANAPAAFAAYFKALDKPSKVTMESRGKRTQEQGKKDSGFSFCRAGEKGLRFFFLQ